MSEFFSKRASGDDEMAIWMQESELAHDRNRPIDQPGIVTYDRTDKGWKANIVQKPGGFVPITYYPFKVYKSPPNPDDDPMASALWRTFRVRAGSFGTEPVLNTDGADENPNDPSTPVTDKNYNAAIDIIVPDTTEKFYIWADCSDPGPGGPFIDSGATIPGGGTDDDWWKGIYFLLCIVDTQTYTDKQRAITRQMVRDDIPKCAS